MYAEYIIQNAGLDEAQAGVKIARRKINNLRHADDTTLMAERGKLWRPILARELLNDYREDSKLWVRTRVLTKEVS